EREAVEDRRDISQTNSAPGFVRPEKRAFRGFKYCWNVNDEAHDASAVPFSEVPFSRRRRTWFSSATASSNASMASVATSSGSGSSSASSSESSLSHLNPSSLNSRSLTSVMSNERQRSSFESEDFLFDLPFESLP